MQEEQLRAIVKGFQETGQGAPDLYPQAERLRKPLAGVMGRPGAGKSSWLNAICNTPFMLPVAGGERSFTTFPHLLSSGTDEHYHLCLRFASQAEVQERVFKAKAFLDECERKNKDVKGDDLIFRRLWESYSDAQTKEGISRLYDSLDGLSRNFRNLDLDEITRLLQHHSRLADEFAPEDLEEDEEEEDYRAEIQQVIDDEKDLSGLLWIFVDVAEIVLPRDQLPPNLTLADLPGLSDSTRHLSSLTSDFLEQCTEVWILAPNATRADFRAFLSEQRALVQSLEPSSLRVVLTKQEDRLPPNTAGSSANTPKRRMKRRDTFEARMTQAQEEVRTVVQEEFGFEIASQQVFLCRDLGSLNDQNGWSDLTAHREQLRCSTIEYQRNLESLENLVLSCYHESMSQSPHNSVEEFRARLKDLDRPQARLEGPSTALGAMLAGNNYQTLRKTAAMKGSPWQCASKNVPLRQFCQVGPPEDTKIFKLDMGTLIFNQCIIYQDTLQNSTDLLRAMIEDTMPEGKERTILIDSVNNLERRTIRSIYVRKTEWMGSSISWDLLRVGKKQVEPIRRYLSSGLKLVRAKVQEKLDELWDHLVDLVSQSLPSCPQSSQSPLSDIPLTELTILDWLKSQGIAVNPHQYCPEEEVEMKKLPLDMCLRCASLPVDRDDSLGCDNLSRILQYVQKSNDDLSLPVLHLRDLGEYGLCALGNHTEGRRKIGVSFEGSMNDSFLSLIEPFKMIDYEWLGGIGEPPVFREILEQVNQAPLPASLSSSIDQDPANRTKDPWSQVLDAISGQTRMELAPLNDLRAVSPADIRMVTLYSHAGDCIRKDHARCLTDHGFCVAQSQCLALFVDSPSPMALLGLRMLLCSLPKLSIVRVFGSELGRMMKRFGGGASPIPMNQPCEVYFAQHQVTLVVTLHPSEIPERMPQNEVDSFYNELYERTSDILLTLHQDQPSCDAEECICLKFSPPATSPRPETVVLRAPIRINTAQLRKRVNEVVGGDRCERVEPLCKLSDSVYRYELTFAKNQVEVSLRQQLQGGMTLLRLKLGSPDVNLEHTQA